MNKNSIVLICTGLCSLWAVGSESQVQGFCEQYFVGLPDCPSGCDRTFGIPGDIGYSWDIKTDDAVKVGVGCDGQSPAFFKLRWIPLIGQTGVVNISGTDYYYEDKSGKDKLNYWCDYDPDVFVVKNSGGELEPRICQSILFSSPYGFSSKASLDEVEFQPLLSVSVTQRVLADPEFRKSNKDKKVKIYAENNRQPARIATGYRDYVSTGEGIYDAPSVVGIIGMTNPSEKSCSSCGSSGGDSSGAGGFSGDSKLITIGTYSADVTNQQDTTLNMFARINYTIGDDGTRQVVPGFIGLTEDGTPEINYPGFWLKPGGGYNSWSLVNQEIVYDESNNTVTKVSFAVKSPEGDTYFYSLSGQWDSKSEARIQSYGKIRLDYVTDNNNKTKQKYVYNTDKVTLQGMVDDDNNADYYVIYEGGVNAENSSDTLKRIWMGKSLDGYSASVPTGGRWLDITTQWNPDSSVGMITEVSSCQSCMGGKRIQDYVPALTNMKRALHGELKDPEPTHYLVNRVKDASENVLVSYNYDAQDRIENKYLGDNEIKVIEATYENKEYLLNCPSIPEYKPLFTQTKMWMGLRDYKLERQYVDSTKYQATETIYDEAKSVTRERKYHDLQSSQNLTGVYSETVYKTEINSTEGVTKKTILLPNKSKVYEYYQNIYGDPLSGVRLQRRVRDGVTEVINYYGLTNDKTVLQRSINEKGATTNYAYDSNGNLTTRIEPASGVFGNTNRLSTYYTYDSYDRMISESANDGRVATSYGYDEFGNLTRQAKGYLESRYAYNEYNEQTLAYECDTQNDKTKNIRRTFYSNVGIKVGEAAYSDLSSMSSTISAVYYNYDLNSRLVTKKTAKKDSVFEFNGSDPGAEESWVWDVYQYDAYGRKTAVIADAGTGNGYKNLTTRYEYNNQSEVVRVVTPDNHYTETVRDGRGLVSQVITGVKVGTQYTPMATTSYYYDLNGNLTKKKDPTGVCECYAYDSLDRKTKTWRTHE